MFLTVVAVVFAATNLSAMTIETVSGRDTTIYNRPLKVTKTFGRLRSTGKYGIFVNITLRREQGERSNDTLFFRLKNGLVREGDILYTVIDRKKIRVAEKMAGLGTGRRNCHPIRHPKKKAPVFNLQGLDRG